MKHAFRNVLIISTFSFSIISLHAQTVTTYAGTTGVQGSMDGPAATATFKVPQGMAMDASGNIYVADMYNNKIRKISSNGFVSTLAGSGLAGDVDGIGTAASFNSPSGVAIDINGNVYVADYWNHKIRMITPGGKVTTFAGSGVEGSEDKKGKLASFIYPQGIAIDKDGNLYVTDSNIQKVRKITPDSVVSTYAGTGVLGYTNGSSANATFNGPIGLTIDADGNVYVSESGNNAIRKITKNGFVSTFAGSITGDDGSADGTGTNATFFNPTGLAMDIQGNMYVADLDNHKIRKITPGGVVTTILSAGAYPTFISPEGIIVDGDDKIYVSDQTYHLILKVIAGPVTSTLTSIDEILLLQVYPSPATDMITISVPEGMAGIITIFDSSGKVILTKNMDSTMVTIPTTTFASGTYLVHFSSDEKSITKKISIVK
jgi:sugar lactone lactonase YvrE